MQELSEDNELYLVVVNDEEQYSIWLNRNVIPAGWQAVGEARTKAECLNYIEQVWTDMRPLSLRRHMEEFVTGRTAGSDS